jgi:hypothetical protein
VSDIQAEIESIHQVATGMTSGAINTANQLKAVMDQLDSFTATSDWSQVPSCLAFGASYTSAIAAFKEVANDLVGDATKMQQALLKIAKDYGDAEQRSSDAFNARMAALGTESYLTHSSADATYKQHKGDLHSDHAEQAPHDAGNPDTTSSGSSTPATPTPTATGGSNRRAS